MFEGLQQDDRIESSSCLGVYYERGQIKNLLERTDEALADFNTAIELFPYNPLAYLHRGNTFKKLGKMKMP